jgi:hypothetical protein
MIISTLFGEVVQTKVCIKCNEEKPLSSFGTRSRDKNGHPTEYRNDCLDCRKEKSKELKELKKSYPTPNIDEHICPLCLRGKSDLSYTAWKNPFVLDHDHITGEARGWICQDCNTALGRIRDDVEIAKRMVEYIEATDRGVYLGVVEETAINKGLQQIQSNDGL